MTRRTLDPDTKRDRIVSRLRRLVSDAKKGGIVLVADAEAIAIRVLTQAERDGADDLRGLGETVDLPDACGGGNAKVGAASSNYGVS